MANNCFFENEQGRAVKNSTHTQELNVRQKKRGEGAKGSREKERERNFT